MSSDKKDLAEINALRKTTYSTRRVCAPELDEILYQPIPVLDHGFIRVIDYMGNDSSIVQAARVSYGAGTKKVSEDVGLIRYLLRHWHTTPFEMCEIKLHVKLPIFVARQWIRHRTANVNEYSARYSILDKEFYVPDSEYLRLTQLQKKTAKEAAKQRDMFGNTETENRGATAVAAQSKVNKQGREDSLAEDEAVDAIRTIKAESSRAYSNYERLLNETADGASLKEGRKGLARELARMVLPVNFYTQWYWKIDLHNLLHFTSLRADTHAQYEIRVYAEAICDILQKWVPTTYDAFKDYRMGGFHLSAKGLEAVKKMLAGEPVTQKDSGLSPREWREMLAALGRDAASS